MTILATGELEISYTNVQTGKTITVNRSGPGKVTVFSDGSELVAAKGPGGLIPRHLTRSGSGCRR